MLPHKPFVATLALTLDAKAVATRHTIGDVFRKRIGRSPPGPVGLLRHRSALAAWTPL